jgi:hypothetical protein
MRIPALVRFLVSFLLAGFLSAPAADGSTDFGVPKVLPIGGIVDGPAMATDGQGVWIAVWMSNAASLGVTSGHAALAFSRSIDDGETWSSAQLLRPELTSDHEYVRADIASDGQGTWIVSHSSANFDPEASVVEVSTSSDDGATWGPPITLVSSATEYNVGARIAGSASGTWIVVWDSHDEAFGDGIFWRGAVFARSTDGGTSWSPAARLSSASSSDGGSPRIVTDSGGTWGVVWRDDEEILQFSRSTDDGQTWSAETPLGRGLRSSLATDGDGRWVVVSDTLTTVDIWQSADDGVVWESRGGVPEVEHVFQHTPEVIARGSGEWQTTWRATDFGHSFLGSDGDVLTMYSRDHGVTWSTPSALVAEARGDSFADGAPAIAISPSQKTIALWPFSGGVKVAAAAPACPATAREDCFATGGNGSGSLSISDAPSGRDRLAWKWTNGDTGATNDADLGDPTVSGDYAVCLYETAGSTPGLISEWDARAATMCGSVPCWRKKANKVRYSDRKLAQGPIASMFVGAGSAGEKIRVSIVAPALSPPRLPLDTSSPVRIQLHNAGTDACWESVHSQAKTNGPESFRSKTD